MFYYGRFLPGSSDSLSFSRCLAVFSVISPDNVGVYDQLLRSWRQNVSNNQFFRQFKDIDLPSQHDADERINEAKEIMTRDDFLSEISLQNNIRLITIPFLRKCTMICCQYRVTANVRSVKNVG